MSNQTNELNNIMAIFFQMNTASTSGLGPLPSNTIANPKGELKSIITQSGIVLDGPFVPIPPPFINSEEDERVEETLTDQDLGLPKLISTYMILELANQAIYTPAGIARDVFVSVGKFTFLANFVIVDYESDPRVPLILGRPFLRIAHALIDVHREEMILHESDERLTINMRHDTLSYSNQPKKESINMFNIFSDSCEDFLKYLFETNHLSGNPTFSSHLDLTSLEVKDDIIDPEGDMVLIKKLINLDSTKDIPPPHNINPLSGSTTSSSPNHLLEEFADELALITFPLGNDDLSFDIEFDLKEIEYLLNHDPIKEMDYILEDSVDEDNLANLIDNLVDIMPEMFTDKHALDYSSPPLYDEYDDDLFEVESSVFLPFPKYDSFLFEDFSKVDALPSTNNEDKVFNLGILIQENLSEVNTRVIPDTNVKKLAISHASLILEYFNPPLYVLPFHKEVPRSKTLLMFSSKNEEKVFKPRILTSKGVHSSLLSKLSYPGPKAFKVIIIFESLMEIFPCFYGEDIYILDVPCLYFYPL
nr:reverse transcriptase domain-containing protein [Tanacetum cinerariifolium]